MAASSPIPRVLLVEDNGIHQRFAQIALEGAGLAVDIAENGEEALVCLSERDYAAILMDCAMPVMTGFEAARKIRAGSACVRNPEIPIIGISADASHSNRCDCITAGMNDWISKPVRLAALREIVQKWLNAPVAG